MNINQVQNPANVWSVTPRTLTGFDGSISPNGGAITNTLANGSNAIFAPPATSMWMLTIVAIATGSVQWAVGLTAGGVFRQAGAAGSALALQATMVSTAAASAYLTNLGTVAGTYAVSIIAWNS
jgi:hypothetical protein